MNTERLIKHWKVVETQLQQASEFLDDPTKFKIEVKPLEGYKEYVDNNEFLLAMEELERLAIEYGCKSGFWRRLKKVADQMQLKDKAAEYEKRFNDALDNAV